MFYAFYFLEFQSTAQFRKDYTVCNVCLCNTQLLMPYAIHFMFFFARTVFVNNKFK